MIEIDDSPERFLDLLDKTRLIGLPVFFMKRHIKSSVSRPIPLLAQAVIILGAVLALSAGIYCFSTFLTTKSGGGAVQVNILELWNNGSYDEILAISQEELKHEPLDSGALIFSGFSSFHKGVSEVTVEKKLPLINQSIINLRKVLLLPDPPLLPEINYILGKAYFHKGKFYADQAIKHLLKAEELGYSASDLNEYLGLAYSIVGRFSEASEYFLKAVDKSPSDLLLWTLGQTYFQMQQNDNAIRYLRLSISKTKDKGLEQRCRFLLGEIFTKTKQFTEAENEYDVILQRNPNSADAHFYLGEIALAQGNKEGAKAEWRKAFKIDPLHFNANQRLFN